MTNRWPLGPKGWAVNELGKEKQVTGQTKLGVRMRQVDARESLQFRTKARCLTSKAPSPRTVERCRSLNATGLRRRKYAVGLRTRQVYDAGSTLSVSERDRSTTPEVRCRSSNATGLRRRKQAVGL